MCSAVRALSWEGLMLSSTWKDSEHERLEWRT